MPASRADRALPITIGAIVAAIFFIMPAVYVFWRVGTTGTNFGDLWDEVPAPLWRTVQLAVLVDRGGRELPIQADYAAARMTVSPQQMLALRRDAGGALAFQLEPRNG